MKKKLSVIVIARDEEKMIEACLKSVKWADEIVVIDNGSVDKTAEVAKKHEARVVKRPSEPVQFSRLRNLGLKEAKGDWLFYLDADERATPELKKEIRETISATKFTAFEIPRRNFYLGKEVHFGGAWPDYVKRLFKKKTLKRWERQLHEDPVFEGEIDKLKEPMLHYTHRDLSSMVEKTKKWSEIEAELLYKNYPGGHPAVTWWRLLRIMLTEFWERGVKKQGWRDGTVGWIEIIFQMFSRFITYARLWEKQQKVKS